MREKISENCLRSGVVIQKEEYSSFSFGRNFRIRCFNFFNVYTYNSEFIVAPVSRNSINKYPSLTLKSLAMTLPAEINTLNFVLRGED